MSAPPKRSARCGCSAATGERMIVDLYAFTSDIDGCALVICAPTGIFYDAQCGGTGCTHPKAEGFFLPLWDVAPSIEDCEFGCSSLTKCRTEFDSPKLRKVFADAIDAELKKLTQFSFVLRFNYFRIDELQEGWWPLRISGTLHDVTGLDHECYYHRGNCD